MMAIGEKDALFEVPLHPYAYHLLRAVPGPALVEANAPPPRPPITPDPGDSPGCPFFARCILAEPGLCNKVKVPARRIEGATLYCHMKPDTLRAAFSFVSEESSRQSA
jgi:oligopeptide/dipeptide ABC transporter ATP-binding protein